MLIAVKVAFHETDIDTDTDILTRKSRVSDVSARILARMLLVSMSVLWNAAFKKLLTHSRMNEVVPR